MICCLIPSDLDFDRTKVVRGRIEERWCVGLLSAWWEICHELVGYACLDPFTESALTFDSLGDVVSSDDPKRLSDLCCRCSDSRVAILINIDVHLA